jgi:regulator of RNase E activity RraB
MSEQSTGDIEQTTTEKGDRNEREAANIIGRVRGKGNVEKVDGYANTDPFGFVDVLAVGDGKPLFVQVKTNRFTAENKRNYRRSMRRLDFEYARFEVWVRVDYEGWRMYRYDPEKDEFCQYIEMETCDHEQTVEAYREAVGYYERQEVATDGGVERRDHARLAHRWGNSAEENIQKWGNQPPKELLLAMAEEMAEIADELLDDNGLPPNAYESEAHTILNDIRTVGYWAREHLEENYENDDGEPLPGAERPDLTGVANPEAAKEETEDLAPLLFQLYWALNDCEVSPATEQEDTP